MRIVIAGASGFVGRELVRKLREQHEIIALSRSSSRVDPAEGTAKPVEWRKCDLFSLLQTEKALEGADVGIYLVHSMIPSARLSQGSFDDFDLIVADNFMRAAEKHQIKQVIYLGGILPEGRVSSRHLQSRHEIEDLFAGRRVPVTVLRAAMIIGAEGSSFNIMTKLVERLPALICPPWTETKSQPIALKDAIACLEYCIGQTTLYNQTFDIAGPDQLSYREMMQTAARKLNLKRRFYRFRYIPLKLSRFWVTLITGAPRNLIGPLIESLVCSMVARPHHLLKPPGHIFASFEEALDEALQRRARSHVVPHAYRKESTPLRFVRSVQRLPLPSEWKAETVRQAYMRWLPRLIPWFLKVRVEEPWAQFSLRGVPWPLLILEYAPERSQPDRQLLYIRGGLLARSGSKGRLEFRETLHGQSILAAIHDFAPSLPWYVYVWTQARVHLWVMSSFRRYLAHKQSTGSRSLTPPKIAIEH